MLIDQDDDIAADIRSALEGQGAPAPEPVQAPEPEAPAAPEAASAGPARDESGRFAKKDEAPQDVATLAAPAEPAQPIIRPPSSWSAEAKAQFAALNPIIQQEVLKREEEINKGKQQWDTKAESYNRLNDLLAPHDERLTLAGQTRETYIRALLTADEMLRGPQKDQALAQIARMYGINFQSGAGQHQPQPQHADPTIQQLTQQVQQLSQSLAQRDEAEKNRQRETLDQEIQAFRDDPKNLYFDNVKAEMGALLDSGAAKDLAQAYDMACYARPDIRALLATATAQQQQPARPAKPAGLSVTGSPPLGGAIQRPNGVQGGSIEDDVRAALQEVTGRI